ncbi:hypothetical protein [Desulfococcus sp.]|uniref:hypothetical protein n=1 Tax=Desulfococcus sp. TaxID=2025834 RepID=UPI00359453D7
MPKRGTNTNPPNIDPRHPPMRSGTIEGGYPSLLIPYTKSPCKCNQTRHHEAGGGKKACDARRTGSAAFPEKARQDQFEPSVPGRLDNGLGRDDRRRKVLREGGQLMA